jgi:hypothetical protein
MYRADHARIEGSNDVLHRYALTRSFAFLPDRDAHQGGLQCPGHAKRVTR